MNTRLALVGLVGASLALSLTGCAPVLPSYETVREAAQGAVQEVVDAMPAGTEVNDRSAEAPFGCSGGGVSYTAQVDAFPDQPFDGEAFLEELPDRLGDDWAVDEDALPIDIPNAAFVKDGMLVSVAVIESDGSETGINVTAISQCGQSPTPVPGG